MTTETLASRVSEGAKWMDRHRPGWAERIDTNELRMSHCTRCVLGQDRGSYWEVVRFFSRQYEHDTRWAEAHGFNLREYEQHSSGMWAALSECWVTEILARRFAAIPQEQPQPVAVTA